MYIHDLNCGWMNHPFARNRFMVDDAATVSKIIGSGTVEVSIDTALGADVGSVKTGAVEVEEIEEPLAEPPYSYLLSSPSAHPPRNSNTQKTCIPMPTS